ncbi:AraC-type DNA-binding protein [Mucilaginibacter pineti]|uniref:AraC-type DNA-binding protein n=1 Tax=Mucilaginibacter pineti TaxID=1391627 RepID=A0A1G7NAN8_9SPHI|nr:AraC family transcriptional regulator [Mucilaginibacter pineti]SDF70439.1 AraC-type DNA-binding protein [Mucilaginibacter pineti]
MKRRLPFQKMLVDVPIQVIRISDFYDSSSFQPHRHNFLMLLWVTKGTGVHQVNFKTVNLEPGCLVFVREEQVHRVIEQPEDGWMILFLPPLFRTFIQQYPAQDQHGLFDILSRTPDVAMDAATTLIFERIVPLLEQLARTHPLDPVIANYLAILLYHANQLSIPIQTLAIHPAQVEQIRQLKNLIEANFIVERHTAFYARKLGIVDRKLNELTMKLTGKIVQDLIYDRLLSEAEALLGTTALSIKEIIYELRFVNNTHFAFFFKKRRGMTPSAFRKMVK